MDNILITGATGFVGGAVLERLSKHSSHSIVAAVRRSEAKLPEGSAYVHVDGLEGHNDWRHVLVGVDVVIHCAARVHMMKEYSSEPLSEYRKVNVQGTLNLARQAAAVGAKRFIFVSSIKVNGEGTEQGASYKPDDTPAPIDPYAISKLEAEQGLQLLASETGMELVVIRPALVYGPGVKANFLSMMHWLNKGIPLPLGAIYNKRSLVALDNLVDLIVTCIDHPAAANQTFLVSDGVDLSTSEMLAKMGRALGKSARLLPVPIWVLQAGAYALNKRALAQRLCGSLQVDISKAYRVLGWSPPVSVDEAFRRTAEHYLSEQKRLNKK